jgi:hypothetical protein
MLSTLAHNTHLRRISMIIYLELYHNYRLVERVESAFTLLSRVTSPQVDHLSLAITLHSFTDLDDVDWARMDRILTQQRWANLRRLSVQLLGRPEMQMAAVELIRARLPILWSRGIVVISDNYDSFCFRGIV